VCASWNISKFFVVSDLGLLGLTGSVGLILGLGLKLGYGCRYWSTGLGIMLRFMPVLQPTGIRIQVGYRLPVAYIQS